MSLAHRDADLGNAFAAKWKAVGSRECGGHISYEWRLRSDRAREASGLAASRLNKHVLWTHVDGWTTKVLAFLAETVAKEGEQDFALQGQPLLELDLPAKGVLARLIYGVPARPSSAGDLRLRGPRRTDLHRSTASAPPRREVSLRNFPWEARS